MAKDVVCGKEVDAALIDTGVSTVAGGAPLIEPSHGTKRFYEGTWYYFCSIGCRQRFMANPTAYVGEDSDQRSS